MEYSHKAVPFPTAGDLKKPIAMVKDGILVGNDGCLGRLCATKHLTLKLSHSLSYEGSEGSLIVNSELQPFNRVFNPPATGAL